MKNKGITLIALVITIIILLILAGIAISSLTGSGLFNKSKEAKKISDYTSAKEMIELKLMEVQVDCTERKVEYTITEIANNIEEDTTITIEKYYNGNTASIKTGVTKNIVNLEGIVVSVDQYSEYKFLIGKSGNIEGVTTGTIDDTTGKEAFKPEEEFVKEMFKDTDESKLTYEIKSRTGTNLEVTVTITNDKGLKEIELLNEQDDRGNNIIIQCNGKNTITKDCTIQIGEEYKVKITSKDGKEKIETILIEELIEVGSVIIGNGATATTSVEDNSTTRGIPLYIIINAKIITSTEGEKACTITNKADTTKVTPYQITKNGTYTFIVSGTHGEKTITEEVEVKVNKYQSAPNLVKYDAGEWTQEEIAELQDKSLYDINIDRSYGSGLKVDNSDRVGFTFGGFTYSGDPNHMTEINEGTIITNRNQSVDPMDGFGSPKYEGWVIYKTEQKEDENGNKITNPDGSPKVYVKSIIHAGSPENFAYYNSDPYTQQLNRRAVYILSSGLRNTSFNTSPNNTSNVLNPRNWDMYKDKELDRKGYIDRVEMAQYSDDDHPSGMGSRFVYATSYDGGYEYIYDR